jgi:hypothetical protein
VASVQMNVEAQHPSSALDSNVGSSSTLSYAQPQGVSQLAGLQATCRLFQVEKFNLAMADRNTEARYLMAVLRRHSGDEWPITADDMLTYSAVRPRTCSHVLWRAPLTCAHVQYRAPHALFQLRGNWQLMHHPSAHSNPRSQA